MKYGRFLIKKKARCDERKNMERVLKEEEKFEKGVFSYELILENMSDGLYCLNSEKTITYWNTAAEKITGFRSSEVVGRKCNDSILNPIDKENRELCKTECPFAMTLQDGKIREVNVWLHHKNGTLFSAVVKVSPIRDSEGKIIGVVKVFYDNTELDEILNGLTEVF